MDEIDVQLPKTVEEMQRRLREAYEEGVLWRSLYGDARISDSMRQQRARLVYPIRKKVPRVVRDSNNVGFLVSMYDNSQITSTGNVISKFEVNAERVALWSDLLSNPFEYVEE